MSTHVLARATACVSCIWALSLFATSMTMAVVTVAKLHEPGHCVPSACIATVISKSEPAAQTAPAAAPQATLAMATYSD